MIRMGFWIVFKKKNETNEGARAKPRDEATDRRRVRA